MKKTLLAPIFSLTALIFSLITLIAMDGCGYTAGAILPSGETSIYIENFANKINISRETSDKRMYYAYRPGIESDITRKIIDAFIRDGNLEVKGAAAARYLLKGELVDFTIEPLRYDANDNIIEHRIRVVTNIEFKDVKEGKLSWREGKFAGESTYRTEGPYAKSEETAMDEAVDDLAQRIVERAVENW